MQVMFVHLTDLHFSTKTQFNINTRREKIINSVMTKLGPKVQEVIIIVSGDIVNKGEARAYNNAYSFLANIRNQLIKIIPSVSFVFSPGNHDCNFDLLSDEELIIRDKIISNFNSGKFVDERNKNINIHEFKERFNIQKRYYDFVKGFKNSNLVLSNPFFDLYSYKIESRKIEVVCYNSSIFSKKNEKQGEIIIDSDLIEKSFIPSKQSLKISVLHHPLEWFNRHNKKYYDNIISGRNIIFSGHEHESNIRTITEHKSKHKYLSVSGAALFNLDYPIKSSFEIVVTDLETMDTVGNSFYFEDNIYKESDSISVNYSSNIITQSCNDFFISSDVVFEFENVDILLPECKQSLKLSDIYVTPQFSEIEFANKELTKEIYYLDELSFSKDSNYISFQGSDRSGKSTVLKQLFKRLREDGKLPILINNTSKNIYSLDEMNKLIDNCFEKLYTKEQLDLYKQFKITNPRDIYILIDDFDKVNKNEKSKFTLLKSLVEEYNNIIFTASSDFDFEKLFNKSEELKNINTLELVDLTNSTSYEFINKWVNLDQELTDVEASNKIFTLKRIYDKVRQNGFIPNNFHYLIMMLSMHDENNELHLTEGTRCYYYNEMLLKVMREINQSTDIQTNFINVYLREYAYFLHMNKDFCTSDEDKFYENLVEKYEYSRPKFYSDIEKLKPILIERNILETRNGLRFKYPFVFYYFCAEYLHKNLDENLSDITFMIDNMFDEDNSNLILFLMYFNNDHEIINQITNTGNLLFSEFPEETSDVKLNILNMFLRIPKKINTIDKLPEQSQRELYKARDEEEQRITQHPAVNIEEYEFGRELIKSMKVIEVISELLKQYSDSLIAPIKRSLVDTNLRLGLRIINFMIDEFSTGVFDLINENELDIDTDVIAILLRVLMSLINSTSTSIGTIESEVTVDKILSERNDMLTKLIHFNYTIETKRTEDEKYNLRDITTLLESMKKDANYFAVLYMYITLSFKIEFIGLSKQKTREITSKLDFSPREKARLLSHSLKRNKEKELEKVI
ncbi:metallophosphoesterase [Mycoplasmatota bacterium WC44]